MGIWLANCRLGNIVIEAMVGGSIGNIITKAYIIIYYLIIL